jgi:hypothetical protein
MKTLLLTSVCAVLLGGAVGPAIAADEFRPVATIQSPALAQQSAAGQQRKGEYGTWPHLWTKADESAATDALNDLETHGYARFSDFHKKGDGFEATVMTGSKAMQVLIDPAKGTVTLES